MKLKKDNAKEIKQAKDKLKQSQAKAFSKKKGY